MKTDNIIENDKPTKTPHDWDATYHKSIDAVARMTAIFLVAFGLKWVFGVSLLSGWSAGAILAGIWVLFNGLYAAKVLWDDDVAHRTDGEGNADNEVLLFKNVLLWVEVLVAPAIILTQMKHINDNREMWQNIAQELQKVEQ